ncbi:hypothetical protein LIPSTDRAFT_243108 [Lipomyces starkeyi NRRL Y-11557]|uniref:Uncharacterized protein n=1 Tax=Lipomyces starkeyi NRRL Y-11557 TaxID=675824 RepID=A0A1E3QCJ6_LIPST|nr:hypothetical protein LIPSTDRAFT_243108 [Lipomyces starkeyi NRRL Y-11557]
MAITAGENMAVRMFVYGANYSLLAGVAVQELSMLITSFCGSVKLKRGLWAVGHLLLRTICTTLVPSDCAALIRTLED